MHNNFDLPNPPPLATLVEQERLALFLDFDGTLVEIAETPGAISLAADINDQLAKLHAALGGRLAVVSGRSIADITRYLAVADMLVVGSHGAELGQPAPPAAILSHEGEARIASLVRQWPGLIIERKPRGFAVHFRQEPNAETSVYEVMEELAQSEGLASKRGKMVVELGPRHTDKGTAVTALLERAGFAGAIPWFIGDDVTDEDGFAAVAAHGGHGILVGRPRPTAAHFRLSGPEEVHQWLTL